MPSSLVIHELDRPEIDTILERNSVGRIAFSHHDRVDIEPIHYVYDEGWIYARTSHGTKLATLARNRWVAFEVDEITSLFDWRSVVVHGAVYVLEPDASAPSRDAWTHAVRLLRRLIPETLTARDPTPERDVLFRIPVQEVTGRRATPAPD